VNATIQALITINNHDNCECNDLIVNYHREAIAAWLDVNPGGKVYNRGTGERQIARMPSFPSFEVRPCTSSVSLAFPFEQLCMFN
jgi:hypothetical protein